MTPRVSALAVAAIALCVAGAPARAQDEADADDVPRCVQACREMVASGELRMELNETGCLVRVCHEQARAYYRETKFDEAEASLDQIHELVEFSPAYQLDRGLVNYALGYFSAALANFDEVLEIRPQTIQAAAQRGHCLLRLQQLPEARAQFEAMLEFEQADTEYRDLRTRSYINGNLGVLRLMEGELAGGRDLLQKALEIDGRNRVARTFLYQIAPALESGQLESAGVWKLVVAFEELSLRRANAGLRQLSSVLNESPNFRLGYLMAAETQRRYLDFEGCETTLRAAEQRFADDTEVFANRIRCTMLRYGIQSPQAVESMSELEALAAKDPDDPLVQEMLLLLGN